MGVFLLTAAIPLAREAGSVSAKPLSERSTPGSFFLCKKKKSKESHDWEESEETQVSNVEHSLFRNDALANTLFKSKLAYR